MNARDWKSDLDVEGRKKKSIAGGKKEKQSVSAREG